MLTERYDIDFLRLHMLPHGEWTPFPPARDRESWERLLAEPLQAARRDELMREADQLLHQPCPQLPATLYMEYARTGNRSHYEGSYFRRRFHFSTLVLAEVLSHSGRYLDEIINYLRTICEEASWCIPAHAERLPNDVLPRPDRLSVDLFACETAAVLAEACFLLREELSAISPGLPHYVDAEIERRVLVPVETRNDFWWLNGGNNWTPWCCGNTLLAACYTLDDPERLAALTYKLEGAVDRFIAGYGDDGGCDEGPGYWAVAAGAMLNFLEVLHSRTRGAIDIYREPRIRNMGNYIVKAHLNGPWFLNFADASARVVPMRAISYRYGQRIGDAGMTNLALLSMREWQQDLIPLLRIIAGVVDDPRHVCVENLGYPFEWCEPLLASLPFSICLDFGHLWQRNSDWKAHLQHWLPRTRIMHLYGFDTTSRHYSLERAPMTLVREALHDIGNYTGVLTLETFGYDDTASSMKRLKECLGKEGLRG